ncbi:MAG: hypothetical protein ACRC6M_04180, partial [Microcystaceae cyanobacterium]
MLVNAGCGGSPSPAPSPSPVGSPGASTPTVPPSPQAAIPSPPPKVPPTAPADLTVLGLIPSTKASQRRQEILAGRTNPFALIPVQATIRQAVCVVPPPPKPGEMAMAAVSRMANAGAIQEAAARNRTGPNVSARVNNQSSEKVVGNLPNPAPRFGPET